MDYRVFRALDDFSRQHTWLAQGANRVETVGVFLFAAAVVLLWLSAEPGGDRTFKVAALAGVVSAGLALLVNRVIATFWDRARPYEAHAGVYHLTSSRDPSFPSDHASAAFAIAFAILFVSRRVGWAFLAAATVIALGRLFIGAHYPSDLLAGLGVGALSAVVVVLAGRPLLERVVRLLEQVSDPAVAQVRLRAYGLRHRR